MPLLKRLRDAVRIAGGRVRRDRLHAVAHSREGDAAFGLIGGRKLSHHYARLYFGDRNDHRLATRAHLWNWRGAAGELARQHGLAVVSEVGMPAAWRSRLLCVPNFVALSVDLPDTEEAYLKALPFSARDDVRRARNRGFTTVIHRDASWAAEFHGRFHRPSVTARHGSEGYVMAPADIAASVTRDGAEFLCIEHDGRRVGALLAEPQPDGYKMGRLGWLDGDMAWVKAGVLGAIYWAAIQRTRERGYTRTLFGGTPPHLEDGVLRFKSKWNARLDPAGTIWGDHHLLLDPAHPHARRLLEGRSFIARGADDAFIVVSGRAPAEVKVADSIARGIARWYRVAAGPDPARATENDELPESLRDWCVRESL